MAVMPEPRKLPSTARLIQMADEWNEGMTAQPGQVSSPSIPDTHWLMGALRDALAASALGQTDVQLDDKLTAAVRPTVAAAEPKPTIAISGRSTDWMAAVERRVLDRLGLTKQRRTGTPPRGVGWVQGMTLEGGLEFEAMNSAAMMTVRLMVLIPSADMPGILADVTPDGGE